MRGKFLFIEVFQLINEHKIIEYHRFAFPTEIMDVGNDYL